MKEKYEFTTGLILMHLNCRNQVDIDKCNL